MMPEAIDNLGDRMRNQETLELIMEGAGDPNGVADAAQGSLYYDRTNDDIWVNIDGATTWILVGGSSQVMHHARATSDNGQAIANGGAGQIVVYEDEEYDTANEYNPATGVFTANRGGYLHIDASILFTTTTTWAPGETAYLSVLLNGVNVACLDWRQDESAANHYLKLGGSTTVSVAAGDTVAINLYQLSGGALPLHTASRYNYVCFDWLL